MRDEGYRALRNDVTDLGERVRRPRSSFPGCGTDPDGRRWNAYTCYADRIVGRAVNRSRGHVRRAGEVRNADHR